MLSSPRTQPSIFSPSLSPSLVFLSYSAIMQLLVAWSWLWDWTGEVALLSVFHCFPVQILADMAFLLTTVMSPIYCLRQARGTCSFALSYNGPIHLAHGDYLDRPFSLFHNESERRKGISLFSWSVVVANVSKEMGSLMKTLRCLFQRGLAPQSSIHTSLKR